MEITTLYLNPLGANPAELARLREGIFDAYQDMPATIELEKGLNRTPVGPDRSSLAQGVEAANLLNELGINAEFDPQFKSHYQIFLIKSGPVYTSFTTQAPHDTMTQGQREVYLTNVPDKLVVHELRCAPYACALGEGITLVTWSPDKVTQFRREVSHRDYKVKNFIERRKESRKRWLEQHQSTLRWQEENKK